MYDDGTSEQGVGFGNGSQNFEGIWLNQFAVIPGQTSITSVQVAWGSPLFPGFAPNGTPVTIGVWSDPNGDGDPTDSLLLGSVTGTVQNSDTDTFVTYTFASAVNLPAGATSFFIGDMTPMNNGPQEFWQGQDTSDHAPNKSWVVANSAGTPVDLNTLGNNDLRETIDSAGLLGNWLIRGNTGNGTPTPTPTVTPTPTPTPPGNALWYNGDFDGTNGLANEQDDSLGAGVFAHTYDDFIVTDANGWDVTSVLSNNLEDLNITGATWEIRQGITEGDGGTLIASGMTTTPIVTATGRNAFGFNEFSIEVPGLTVHLDATGQNPHYFLNVTPIGDGINGRSFVSTTSGANAVGQPPGNNQNAFFDSPFFAAVFTSTANEGQPYDFSMGVNGTVTGGGGLTLQSAASIKTHGTAGTFSIPLPLTGNEGIEDRAGADTIAMTFNNNITNVGTATSTCGNATVRMGMDTHTVLVKLGSAAQCSGQNITVTLSGVMDDQGNTGSATVTYGKLIGDVNADGTVNGKDIKIIRQTAPAQTNSSNFRDDVSVDGKINLSDVLVVRRHGGQSLP
ncbi:MAG: dockerin type I domain-containing protein [Chthoniobacterales bacterium]